MAASVVSAVVRLAKAQMTSREIEISKNVGMRGLKKFNLTVKHLIVAFYWIAAPIPNQNMTLATLAQLPLPSRGGSLIFEIASSVLEVLFLGSGERE